MREYDAYRLRHLTDEERQKVKRWIGHIRDQEAGEKLVCLRSMNLFCEVARVHDYEPAWKRRRRS